MCSDGAWLACDRDVACSLSSNGWVSVETGMKHGQNVQVRAMAPVRVHGEPQTPAFQPASMTAAQGIVCCVPPTKERSETTKPFSCNVPSQMRSPLTAADHPSDHRVSGSGACDEYRERLDMSSIDGPRTAHVISRSITSLQTHLHRALVQVMLELTIIRRSTS